MDRQGAVPDVERPRSPRRSRPAARLREQHRPGSQRTVRADDDLRARPVDDEPRREPRALVRRRDPRPPQARLRQARRLQVAHRDATATTMRRARREEESRRAADPVGDPTERSEGAGSRREAPRRAVRGPGAAREHECVPMSQWPSDHRYTIPVAGDQDVVTVTIDGKEVQAPRGELLIKVAQEHGTYIPRFCYHERMKPVGMCRMCLVEVEGMRGLQISCATPGRRRHGRQHAVRRREDRAGRRARVPPHQPSARLPGLRPRRRVPAPGPDARVRSRRVALRRGEAALREADPDQRPRAARPGALHPVRSLHPVRGRGRRRPADRLRRPRRHQTEVITYPDEPFTSYFSGNVVQICPVGALTARPVPLQGAPVGPRGDRDVVPDVRGRLPRARSTRRRTGSCGSSASTPSR